MPIAARVATPVRAHWKRALLPFGFVATLWSNSAYEKGNRSLFLVLSLAALALTLWSLCQWRRAMAGWKAPRRARARLRTNFVTPAWQGLKEEAKVFLWGCMAFYVSMYPLKLADRIVAAPIELNDHVSDAQIMLVICFVFPLVARWLEPQNKQLERLDGRALRAMTSRTLANFNGACGAAALLYAHFYAMSTDYLKIVPALAITIGIATIVATQKMWSRYRKLCTLTHQDTQTLIRVLEQPPAPAAKAAVLEAWDAVERDVGTRVDTGFAFGVRLAPKTVSAALANAIDTIVRALPDAEEARARALNDLKAVRDMCAARIDVTA
jgi:hypothetical protein